VKLKQKPEDFVVTESWRFDKAPKGEYRVYEMDKQKLSTFEAVSRIAKAFNLPHSVFSFCGLKDKQGRTKQLIAVRGAEVDMQDEDLRLKFLGRTDKPLSAENTTSNRFGVTVRGLSDSEIARVPASLAEINRRGVVNYFDSQRFGSLKHGQGFIAKDLLRGDFEGALKNVIAKPSDLDKTYDAKVKAFWRDHWGEWRRRCTIPGADRYERIIGALRHDPKNFREAFLRIDSKTRAMLVFTYQSYLWNEGVRRLLMSLLSGQSLMAIKYQAGTLLFPRDVPAELLPRLRNLSFPLLGPETKIEDPDVAKAVDWVLGREKLSVAQLQVPETPEIFFRHEERPVLVYPGRLMIGSAHPDEMNRTAKKLYVAFTLPPGSYATLVIRRLFHFSAEADYLAEEAEARARVEQVEPEEEPSEKPPRRGERPAGPRRDRGAASGPRAKESRRPSKATPERGAGKRPAAKAPVAKAPTVAKAPPVVKEPAAPPEPKLGFRALQKLKKEQKSQARAQAAKKAKK